MSDPRLDIVAARNKYLAGKNTETRFAKDSDIIDFYRNRNLFAGQFQIQSFVSQRGIGLATFGQGGNIVG